VKQIKEYYEAG